MVYFTAAITYRVCIDKDPPFSPHEIQSIDDGIELFKFAIIISQAFVFPDTFFFPKINIDRNLVAEQAGRCNDLAILLKAG